jgi:hypothetical protein
MIGIILMSTKCVDPTDRSEKNIVSAMLYRSTFYEL